MALYIPHSIFHLARLLYVRPETVGPYYVPCGAIERSVVEHVCAREGKGEYRAELSLYHRYEKTHSAVR